MFPLRIQNTQCQRSGTDSNVIPLWVKCNAMYVQRLLLNPVDSTVSVMSARGLDVLYEDPGCISFKYRI